MQAKITELDKRHYEKFQIAQTTINRLRADVAAGRKRLSVKVKSPVCPKADPGTTGLDDGTTRAELDGQDAEDLIGIVIQGDRAIRQLNALQDYVEEIVESSGQ
ncbi:MAG: lysis system i-spanin subunit Rz [Novosphingobium sp.]